MNVDLKFIGLSYETPSHQWIASQLYYRSHQIDKSISFDFELIEKLGNMVSIWPGSTSVARWDGLRYEARYFDGELNLGSHAVNEFPLFYDNVDLANSLSQQTSTFDFYFPFSISGVRITPLQRVGSDRLLVSLRPSRYHQIYSGAYSFVSEGMYLALLPISGHDPSPVMQLAVDTPLYNGSYTTRHIGVQGRVTSFKNIGPNLYEIYIARKGRLGRAYRASVYDDIYNGASIRRTIWTITDSSITLEDDTERLMAPSTHLSVDTESRSLSQEVPGFDVGAPVATDNFLYASDHYRFSDNSFIVASRPAVRDNSYAGSDIPSYNWNDARATRVARYNDNRQLIESYSRHHPNLNGPELASNTIRFDIANKPGSNVFPQDVYPMYMYYVAWSNTGPADATFALRTIIFDGSEFFIREYTIVAKYDETLWNVAAGHPVEDGWSLLQSGGYFVEGDNFYVVVTTWRDYVYDENWDYDYDYLMPAILQVRHFKMVGTGSSFDLQYQGILLTYEFPDYAGDIYWWDYGGYASEETLNGTSYWVFPFYYYDDTRPNYIGGAYDVALAFKISDSLVTPSTPFLRLNQRDDRNLGAVYQEPEISIS